MKKILESEHNDLWISSPRETTWRMIVEAAISFAVLDKVHWAPITKQKMSEPVGVIYIVSGEYIHTEGTEDLILNYKADILKLRLATAQDLFSTF